MVKLLELQVALMDYVASVDFRGPVRPSEGYTPELEWGQTPGPGTFNRPHQRKSRIGPTWRAAVTKALKIAGTIWAKTSNSPHRPPASSSVARFLNNPLQQQTQDITSLRSRQPRFISTDPDIHNGSHRSMFHHLTALLLAQSSGSEPPFWSVRIMA